MTVVLESIWEVFMVNITGSYIRIIMEIVPCKYNRHL